MKHIAVVIQNLLPQPHLARGFGRLARSRRPWLRRLLIRLWMQLFDVSLVEARRPLVEDYDSFEDFFTRELLPDARPQPADERVISAPADGYLQNFGPIRSGEAIQAKGIGYPLGSLLGDYRLAADFEAGWYATIYLSPADYHRLHAPCDATLRAFNTIPGQAYSVTRDTRRHLPDLYCRNERMVCRFDTPFGPLAMVMVGAMLVSGIETVWRPRAPIERFESINFRRVFQQGEEVGRFTLGSTVVMIFSRQALTPDPGLSQGQDIRTGASLGVGHTVPQ